MMSRIPELMDDSTSSLYLWWKQMAAAGLAFHPDDNPHEVLDGDTGNLLFTPQECVELESLIERMSIMCGDEIFDAALQATEAPDITEVREEAIRNWASNDIDISPYAEVEKVDGGYWVTARMRVYAE